MKNAWQIMCESNSRNQWCDNSAQLMFDALYWLIIHFNISNLPRMHATGISVLRNLAFPEHVPLSSLKLDRLWASVAAQALLLVLHEKTELASVIKLTSSEIQTLLVHIKSVENDVTEAKWFGGVIAQYGFAGHEVDPVKAFNCFNELADNDALFNCKAAYYHLAKCYAERIGVERDDAMAKRYYQLGDLTGHGGASYELGRMSEIPGNALIVASNKYAKAANQGYFAAQFGLGRCHEHGIEEGPSNIPQAIFWYSQAAAQHDDPTLCLALARCYEMEGISKNLIEAERWYEKAAQLGDKLALASVRRLFIVNHPSIKSPTNNNIHRNSINEFIIFLLLLKSEMNACHISTSGSNCILATLPTEIFLLIMDKIDPSQWSMTSHSLRNLTYTVLNDSQIQLGNVVLGRRKLSVVGYWPVPCLRSAPSVSPAQRFLFLEEQRIRTLNKDGREVVTTIEEVPKTDNTVSAKCPEGLTMGCQ